MVINYADGTGEFALIISLSLSISQKTGKGRLKNLLEKLRLACEEEFRKFPPMYGKVEDINKRIVSWSENCGWDEEVEVITFVSFLLGLIDQSDYTYPPRILDYLNEIHEFITDGRDYIESYRLADHALQVWSAYDKLV